MAPDRHMERWPWPQIAIWKGGHGPRSPYGKVAMAPDRHMERWAWPQIAIWKGGHGPRSPYGKVGMAPDRHMERWPWPQIAIWKGGHGPRSPDDAAPRRKQAILHNTSVFVFVFYSKHETRQDRVAWRRAAETVFYRSLDQSRPCVESVKHLCDC